MNLKTKRFVKTDSVSDYVNQSDGKRLKNLVIRYKMKYDKDDRDYIQKLIFKRDVKNQSKVKPESKRVTKPKKLSSNENMIKKLKNFFEIVIKI